MASRLRLRLVLVLVRVELFCPINLNDVCGSNGATKTVIHNVKDTPLGVYLIITLQYLTILFFPAAGSLLVVTLSTL